MEETHGRTMEPAVNRKRVSESDHRHIGLQTRPQAFVNVLGLTRSFQPQIKDVCPSYPGETACKASPEENIENRTRVEIIEKRSRIISKR